MCSIVYWTACLCLFFSHGCHALVSWNMHDLCGTEISWIDNAGEVNFDAIQLPSSANPDECTLTVTPAKLDENEHNMILFYFTKFELTTCDDMTVSVKDGRSDSDITVQDFPHHLCELTDQIFYPSGESFFIQVNTKMLHNFDGSFKGAFALNFMTYYSGSCDDSGTYECDNGHCIPQLHNCSEVAKACGDTEDYQHCMDESDESFGNWLGNIVRYIFLIVAIMCGLCVLKVMLKKGKKKCDEGCDCLEDCFREIRIKCRNCTNSIKLRRLRLPQFIRRRLRSNNPDTTDAFSSGITDASSTSATGAVSSGGTVNPGFYSTDSRTDSVIGDFTSVPPVSHVMTSRVEPPSYEEVMAPPSYEELDMRQSTDIYSPSQTNEPPLSTTEITSTDTNGISSSQEMTSRVEPPSYEEIMVPYHRPVSFITIEEEAPPSYEEIDMTQSIDIYPPSQTENITNDTNDVSTSHENAAFESDDRVMNSNQIILSSMQTDSASILDGYLNQFDVELSDGYSTDLDWVPESTISNAQSDRTIELQSVSNVTVADMSTSHENPDIQSDDRIINSNQIILSSMQTDSASILDGYLNQFDVELSDGYSTDLDWESDSNISNAQSDRTIELQFVSNVNVAVADDNPVPPSAYEEAALPPYYYDYIANVSQYK